MPLVSAVMRSYNQERFLSDAIASVLRQDLTDLELVIVDGGSTDSSIEIAERYEQQDARVRLLCHESNLGMAKAINDGIDASRGKFIAEIDSDDMWRRNLLTKKLAVLEKDESLVVWSEGELIDSVGRSMNKSWSELTRCASKNKNGDIFQELLPGNYILAPGLMYEKQSIRGIRRDERFLYMADYKFLLQLAQNYQFCYIPEPLAQYRIHDTNASLGSSDSAKARRRIHHREYISICEEALRSNTRPISSKLLADTYRMLGFSYFYIGQNRREGLRFLMQAVKLDPLSWSNLSNSIGIVKPTIFNLLNSQLRAEAA